MRRVSLSGLEKSIQAIWEWYDFQSNLSLPAADAVRQQILAGAPSNPIFFAKSLDEIDDFFKELDYVAMLDLLASAEAAIRINFLQRAYIGKRDAVARDFRRLYKSRGSRVRLEEDILETWRTHRPGARKAVGDFKGALNLRHWLAHGRYWTPKFGIDYSPGDVFDIANNLLICIGI